MNKLICVAGMPGSGKSIVSDYFATRGFQFVRFGQIVLDEIIKNGLKPTETNERRIRETIRDKHGIAGMAILNYPKFRDLLKKGNVIADGLYGWSEYKFLKEKFGKQMFVIGVFAPPMLRYERLSSRKMTKEDKELRHRTFTKNEAKSRDYAEIENLEKGGPIAMADYTLINTKDIEFLNKQAKEIFSEISGY